MSFLYILAARNILLPLEVSTQKPSRTHTTFSAGHDTSEYELSITPVLLRPFFSQPPIESWVEILPEKLD